MAYEAVQTTLKGSVKVRSLEPPPAVRGECVSSTTYKIVVQGPGVAFSVISPTPWKPFEPFMEAIKTTLLPPSRASLSASNACFPFLAM